MDIHTLMKRFAELEGAGVGFGPKHPTSPNLSIADEIESFLREYPFLRQDTGYVDFLQCYAGAHYVSRDHRVVIDIFGFADQSSHMIDLEGEIIEAGFLCFCNGAILAQQTNKRETKAQAFAFDATGNRQWGIYDGISEQYYCGTFLEWLNDLIEKKGLLT